MKNTQVKDLMEKTLVRVRPEDNLYVASKKMKETDCGCLPVGTTEELEGVITDRDIITRCVAEDCNPVDMKVSECMSKDINTCHQDDTLIDAAKKMCSHNTSRLIVIDDNDKICGILSFGKILRNHDDSEEMTEVIACATDRK